MVLSWNIPSKMNDLGVPPFEETAIYEMPSRMGDCFFNNNYYFFKTTNKSGPEI